MSIAKRQLKPDIQLNIATYKIYGELNIASAKEIINRIENHLHILRGLHVEGLLLSFAEITKIDKDALDKVIYSFSSFHVKLRSMIGFCDYSPKLFPSLRELVKSSPLGLYRSMDIMALAIGTSNVNRRANILVYADNVDERQLIASTLISNNYFVVIALSESDFQRKTRDKSRFDRIIKDSYFSNIHDDVIISYERNAFVYEFQGTLDETLSKRINVEDFKYRLSLGYNVIIFDFTRIYHMNLRAAYFLLELETIANSYKSLVCGIELKDDRIDTNALGVLEKSEIWLFDDLDHVHEDEEVVEKIAARKPHFSTGISKKLLELTPHFIAASMQSLQIYEILNPKKSPLKQANVRQLHALRPKVVTHIVFSGDYEGEFFFLFTQESAEILIKQILVDFDEYAEEDFLDGMREFVNSLTGKMKSNLRKRNKCIQFSLPKSSPSFSEILPLDLPQTFILTNFKCNDYDYYVALTSPMEEHYSSL